MWTCHLHENCFATFHHNKLITPGQIRAGRALIGWTQVDLAKASGVSEITIKKIERAKSDPRISTIGAIQRAFDGAGIIFLDSDECAPGGPGVRLKTTEPQSDAERERTPVLPHTGSDRTDASQHGSSDLGGE
jgi:DNA-binding XRE family transcriptional regulator